MADVVLGLGFYIGIDGPITYKSAEKLRRVVDFCPLDKILLETDCPYLTPVPYRGKRNEPSYITYIMNAVALIKGVSKDIVADQTTGNAKSLFGEKIRDYVNKSGLSK